MDPEKYNSAKPAWYSSIAMPLAEDVPVPSGDGPHGCLVMCGPSQVMSPKSPLDIVKSTPPGITLQEELAQAVVQAAHGRLRRRLRYHTVLEIMLAL